MTTAGIYKNWLLIFIKSIDNKQIENKSYKITECYTKNCTTKFRHAHQITLIILGMSI